MASLPSVKGSLIAPAVEKTRKLLDAGALSRRELEAKLTPEDLAEFEAPVNPSKWYDVKFYERLAELLYELEGGSREECYRKLGFARGQALIEGGLYQQMEYLGRAQVNREMDPEARFEAYGRDLKLLVTLSAALLNFSRWSVERDPDHDSRYRIEVREALAFRDFLGWGSEGLINAMAASHGLPDLWRYERFAPDFVVFRMQRSI